MRYFYDAASILMEGTNDTMRDIMPVLEDATSPVTQKYQEKLFQSIIDRAHVDFDDIPKSKGDITKYKGYEIMLDTLNTLINLGKTENSKELVEYATTVITTIDNIKKMKSVYTKGFMTKNDYVTVDYNIYVATCVEATTSLLSAFVNDLQSTEKEMKIILKNTKYRGNLFYVECLEKYNTLNKDGRYGKYLNATIEAGKKNMVVSSVLLGAGAILAVVMAIVPVTRALIYRYKETKRKLSETLAKQAYFLELNKNCLEYNQELDKAKKKKILAKQEKTRNMLLHLSDKLKVEDARTEALSRRELEKDNKTMTLDGIRDEISDSDISIV